MNIKVEKYKHNGLIYNLYDDGTAELVGIEIEGSIDIPETISKGSANYVVTRLNSLAYQGSKNVIRIRIPSSVINVKIADYISGYSNLNCIEVQQCNAKFTAKDGVLFNKELTTLIQYPAGKQDDQYTIPNSVTNVGECAFCRCTSLNSIVISNSVTEIGNSAFSGCTGLNSIVIPNSVTEIGNSAFKNCTSLNSIVVPNSVTNIGGYAFAGCTSLNSIVIPNSVTKIRNSAFYKCTSLNSIVVPNSVTNIGEWAFYYCTSLNSIVIPNSVTEIGKGAFHGCTSLNSIVIPNSVTNIGDCAFWFCSSLKSIVIPNSVTEIGKGALFGCTSLKRINIAEGNPYYEEKDGVLFSKELTILIQYPAGKQDNQYTIPCSVTNIERNAFRGCTSLKRINVAEGNPYYEEKEGVLFSKGLKNLIKYPEGKQDAQYTIPPTISNIESRTFADCTSIESIVISDSVTNIGECAFQNCTSLNSIVIPNSVTNIGAHAFYGCTSIKSVTIPNSVTNIGDCAFGYCTSLKNIVIPNSITKIGECAFYYCTSLNRINVVEGNPYYEEKDGVLFSKELTTLIQYPAGKQDDQYTIPNSVTNIERNAFQNCTSIKRIVIPNSVRIINITAFSGCIGLANLYIPATVSAISYGAFNGCHGLNSLYIEDGREVLSLSYDAVTSTTLKKAYFGRQMSSWPSSCSALEKVEFGENVTSIASRAFKSCTSISSVITHNETPPTTEDTFSDETYINGTLYVPESSINDYQNATGWKNFKTIKSIDEFDGVGDVYAEDDTTFSVCDGVLHVSGDAHVRVVALNGTVVYSGRGNQDINLNKGMYIVVIGNKASKIVVK
jgi:hypothetical protein